MHEHFADLEYCKAYHLLSFIQVHLYPAQGRLPSLYSGSEPP